MGVLSFLSPLLVYGVTLCRTVGFVDAGELAVSSYLLGIPHPTGYPTYTLLGRFFTLLPLGTVILRTNLMSAVFAAGSSLFLYLAAAELLSSVEKDRMKLLFVSFFSAVAFSFSATLWSQAVVTEVYSLTALFASIILYLSFSRSPRAPLLFAYFFGLALTNHMTIILVGVPVFCYFLLSRRIHTSMLPLFTLLFFAGLSAYMYLPIRAMHDPVIEWGDPSSFERFIWHVTGKQYRVWMFASSPGALVEHLASFGRLLMAQYTPFLLWLPVVGVLLSRKMKAVYLLLAVFVVDVLYSINYDIPDIDAYYVPAFLTAALALALGLDFLLRRAARMPALLLASVVSLVPFASNYYRCDMSRNRIAYDYGANFLRSIDRGGLCLTNNWDIYSPVLYISQVEGKRKDVVMIDKELLRRSWYVDNLRREYPATCAAVEPEIESYLEELRKFEHGTLEDPAEIQRRFIGMINSLIQSHAKAGPAYTTFVDGRDVDAADIGAGFEKTPHGLVFEFTRAVDPQPFDWTIVELDASFRSRTYRDERTAANLATYPRMMFLSGMALMRADRHAAAAAAFETLLSIEENTQARLCLGNARLLLEDYQAAAAEFERVLLADPGNELAARGLEMARLKASR